MSDQVVETVTDSVKDAVENATSETITNEKIPATPEGIVVAYGSLVVMAMLPIVFGSIRSVKLHKLKKVIKNCINRIFIRKYPCTYLRTYIVLNNNNN